jgi:hypothetical protein
MMRLSVRFSIVFAGLGVLALGIAPRARAQAQTQSQSTSSSQSAQLPSAPQYVVIDPLANVRYDNRYDLYIGAAYRHMKAGPMLLQGSNIGGIDADGSYWFAKRWGAEGTFRYYLATTGAGLGGENGVGGNTNEQLIKGPFIDEYFFGAGPEWLGPHNKHGDLIAHAMFGGVYGNFEHDLRGLSPSCCGFYNTQLAPMAIIGGHIDLNRSPRWVFRITPDSIWTWYGIQYGAKYRQTDVNFAISVGVEYKFKPKRR